jgi:23S rRNA pseudouridine2605 synthase
MFSAIGHTVLKLKRVEYGPIQLGDLPFGQSRYLKPEEIEKLKKISTEYRVQSAVCGVRRDT